MKTEVHFREVQRVRQPQVWFLVGGIAVLLVVVAAGELVSSFARVASIAAAVLLLALVDRARLTTEVREDGVYVRFAPFHLRPRVVRFEDLLAVSRREYRPATPLGRWGVHLGFGPERTYNLVADEGVAFTYRADEHPSEERQETLVVGTEVAKSLVVAVRRAARSRSNVDWSEVEWTTHRQSPPEADREVQFTGRDERDTRRA